MLGSGDSDQAEVSSSPSSSIVTALQLAQQFGAFPGKNCRNCSALCAERGETPGGFLLKPRPYRHAQYGSSLLDRHFSGRHFSIQRSAEIQFIICISVTTLERCRWWHEKGLRVRSSTLATAPGYRGRAALANAVHASGSTQRPRSAISGTYNVASTSASAALEADGRKPLDHRPIHQLWVLMKDPVVARPGDDTTVRSGLDKLHPCLPANVDARTSGWVSIHRNISSFSPLTLPLCVV